MAEFQEWAQVSCIVPDGMVDAISDFLIELSSAGVGIENLVLDTFSLDTVEESPFKTVTAYFPVDGDLATRLAEISAYLHEHGPSFPGFHYQEPSLVTITEEDWSNNWKEHFKPVRVGNRLVIKPTWEDFPAVAEDIVLELDPGMAFGTGTHPTTRLCLVALEQIATLLAESGTVWRALDVGTGSGILSMAAAKLGAVTVTAIDIDPEAVRVAGENCALNGVADRVAVSDRPLSEIFDRFGLVLANILAEDLVRMAAALTACLDQNGFLVLSGILIEKEPLVIEGFAARGLVLHDVAREDEWSCLVFRKEAA
jgi:ribosomal protein L11 methyltransferase